MALAGGDKTAINVHYFIPETNRWYTCRRKTSIGLVQRLKGFLLFFFVFGFVFFRLPG